MKNVVLSRYFNIKNIQKKVLARSRKLKLKATVEKCVSHYMNEFKVPKTTQESQKHKSLYTLNHALCERIYLVM